MSQHRAPRRAVLARPRLDVAAAAFVAVAVVGVTAGQAVGRGTEPDPGPGPRRAAPLAAPAPLPARVRAVVVRRSAAPLAVRREPEPPAVTGQDRAVAASPVLAPSRVPDAVLEDLPPGARETYHRATAVLADARVGCRLDWSLLAGVGLVASGHGRAGGGVLDDELLLRPPAYGRLLDGVRGRDEVRDTDAGLLDRKRRWDRTVGPLHLLPATWATYGVDADDDGRRDPQDLDDAALAVGVLLCSHERDLTHAPAARRALGHLHPDRAYARRVLAAATSYADQAAALDARGPTVPVVVRLPPPPEPKDETLPPDEPDRPDRPAEPAEPDRPGRPDRPDKPDEPRGPDGTGPPGDGVPAQVPEDTPPAGG